MFFCYVIINGYFTGNYDEADRFSKILEGLLVDTSYGLRMGKNFEKMAENSSNYVFTKKTF